VSEMEIESQKLRDEQTRTNAALQQAQDEVYSSQSTIESLQKEVKKLGTKIDNLREEASNGQKRVLELQNELSSMNVEKSRTEDKLVEAERVIQKFHSSGGVDKALVAQITTLEERLQDTEAQLDKALESARDAEKNSSIATSAAEEAKNELQEFSANRADTDHTVAEQKTRIDEFMKNEQEQQQIIDDLKSQVQSTQKVTELKAKQHEQTVADLEAIKADKEAADASNAALKENVTSSEDVLDQVTMQMKSEQEASRMSAEKATAELSKLSSEIASLQQRLQDAEELQKLATGSGPQAPLLAKLADLSKQANRAEASRIHTQQQLEQLQQEYQCVRVRCPESTDSPEASKPNGKNLADKLDILKERRQAKAKNEEDKLKTTTQAATASDIKEALRRKKLGQIYHKVNSSPIPVQTSMGTAHISQAAYLRKISNSGTRPNGTLSVGAENAMETLIALTKQSDAEKYLMKVRGMQGTLPRRKKYEVYTTTFANDTAVSQMSRIRQIFEACRISFKEYDLHQDETFKQELVARIGEGFQLPCIFINDVHLDGGLEELQSLHDSKELKSNTC